MEVKKYVVVATADVMTFVLVFMETNGFAQKFCGQT
jgi:hypothetical protein